MDAIYVRISDDNEGKSLGVQRQADECRKLAERLDSTGQIVFSDNDISASRRSKKRRPEWDTMLQRIQSGEIRRVFA